METKKYRSRIELERYFFDVYILASRRRLRLFATRRYCIRKPFCTTSRINHCNTSGCAKCPDFAKKSLPSPLFSRNRHSRRLGFEDSDTNIAHFYPSLRKTAKTKQETKRKPKVLQTQCGGNAYTKKLRAVNKLPSTNTKTKLDLTKLTKDFHKPLVIVCKYIEYFRFRQVFLQIFL